MKSKANEEQMRTILNDTSPSVNFKQVVKLVKQLPFQEKIKLGEVIRKETMNIKDEDIILCQITSQQTKDEYSILIKDDDFRLGNLPVKSNIRPNRIFTADKNIVIKKVASINEKAMKAVTEKDN